MTTEHLRFLKKIRRRRRMVVFLRILILFLFLLQWEICADTGVVDSFIFSSPSRIVTCFLKMTEDGSIFHHIGITLYETLVSFLLVTLTSILIAILLWCFHGLSEILDPYMVVLNSLPKSALAPLLIVWLGANTTTIVVARNVRCNFRKYPEPLHQFFYDRPGKNSSDLHTTWKTQACADQGGSSWFHSGNHQ